MTLYLSERWKWPVIALLVLNAGLFCVAVLNLRARWHLEALSPRRGALLHQVEERVTRCEQAAGLPTPDVREVERMKRDAELPVP